MRGRTLLLLVLVAYALVPPASSIVDVYVAPENVTVGEKFIIFVKITDPHSSIILDPASSVFANYSSGSKPMSTINSKYAAFTGASEYWTTADDYAANTEQNISIYARYSDSVNGNIMNENASVNITPGSLSIVMTSTNFNMTKKVGETIFLEGFMMDASGSAYMPGAQNKMSYIVYGLAMNPSGGENLFSACGAQFCANYTITQATPFGIISIYGTNGTDYGGRNIFFAAVPYSANLSISNTYPAAGDSVEVALNPNNTYGIISGVYANLTFPNGTTTPIQLTEANGYKYSYAAPNMSGNYILNTTVNHTISGMTNHNSAFMVRTAYLDVRTDKAAYKPGENVTVTATIYDSNGTAIPGNMNATINSAGGASTPFPDAGMVHSANTKSFNYTVNLNASAGEYNVTINASDNFGRMHYGKASFNVNAPDKSLVATPTSIAATFRNTTSNITYKINLTSNSSANISEIHVSLSSSIIPYAAANATGIHVPLIPGASTAFDVTIIPNESVSGTMSGSVAVNFDGNTLSIPVTIVNGLSPSFNIFLAQSLKVIAGKKSMMQIAIKNNGTGKMSGIGMSAGESISRYISNIGTPEIILSGGTTYVYFDVTVPEKGTYNGNIMFSAAGAAPATVALSIEAFGDISPQIDALGELRRSLGTRILALEANGNDMALFNDKINSLQEGVNELRSLYDNGRYPEAKAKLAELQLAASEIQSDLDSMESSGGDQPAYGTDGVCERAEPCSSTDCIGDERCSVGSSNTSAKTIMIAALLVVAIVIVLATSIMPDEKRQKPVRV